MTLEEFISKYNILISEDILSFCLAGVDIARESVDPMHDETHIYRLLDIFDELLKNEKGLGEKISFEVMLVSICWHDVWKAKHNARNIPEWIFQQFVEGVRSARLLRNFSKNYKINKEIINSSAYVIKRHAMVQRLFKGNLESLVLNDLDEVESYNFERIHKCSNHPVFGKKLFLKSIQLLLMISGSGKRTNFDWSKKAVLKVSKRYLTRYSEVIEGKQVGEVVN